MDDIFKIQQLIAHFANSFDIKDWSGLESCFTDSIYTDYSDLRGTPPETINANKYVKLRREALDHLKLHPWSATMRLILLTQTPPPVALRWLCGEDQIRKISRLTASIFSS